jgi:transposase-like protein
MKNKKEEIKAPDMPKRKLTFHDDDFKRKVIAEYLDGDVSKESIQKKYGIKADSAITRWMRKFGIVDPFAKTPYLGFVKEHHLKKKEPTQLELENKALQKKVRDLEGKLSQEQLRAEMYARVIEKAEKELHIPILKKSGTK